MKLNKDGKLKIAAAALSTMMAITSCAQAKDKSTTATTETLTYTSESTSDITSSTESESYLTETEYTGFSVETEAHDNNPFGDFIYDESYNSVTVKILNSGILPEVMYGFDNPYSINKLQEEVYDRTGVLDTNLTLSDVNYFQYNPIMVEYLNGGSVSFSEHNEITNDPYFLEGARAVLSSLGLRFGIDEIPAWYLMERFPRFYYDVMQFQVDNRTIESGELVIPNSMNGFSFVDPTSADFSDFLLFYGCVYYNMWRLDCVYSNPYGSGCITQVRDAATGKNVLVPTDSQAQAMQEDINSIPGMENVSIYASETPEEFYNCYGYYPDEALQNVGNLNTQASFESYISGLSSSEKNDLYRNAIEDRLNNPQKGSSKSR